MKKTSLEGIFDMHVHTAPDVKARKYTDFELVDAAVRVGARGIVLKCHHGSTAERAQLSNWYNAKVHGKNDLTVYGGIVLNEDVGGLNPKAVETAFAMGAKEVWMPTIDSVNDRQQHGLSGGLSVLKPDGSVKADVQEIMKMVAEHDAVLATGHLSHPEIFAAVRTARSLGVKRIVITHPEYWVVHLSLDEQKELIDLYDVIMERVYKQPMPDGSWKDNCPANLEAIEKLGAANTMLATDSGQPNNPPWEEGFANVLQFMADHGVKKQDILHMTREVPAWLLGVGEHW